LTELADSHLADFFIVDCHVGEVRGWEAGYRYGFSVRLYLCNFPSF
jgi:hypothetical protein